MVQDNKTAVFQFKVLGMTCEGCARSVQNAIKKVDEKAEVIVKVSEQLVSIQTPNAGMTPAEKTKILRDAIELAGFEVPS